jgi:hypothetical protein
MEEKSPLKARLWQIVKRDALLTMGLGLLAFVLFIGTVLEFLGASLTLVGVLWLVHSYTRLIALEIQARCS